MKLTILILITLIFFSTYSQSKVEYPCSPDFPHGKQKVDWFLNAYEQRYSLKVGASNQKTNQIELVSSAKECISLRNFISKNEEYNEINQKRSHEETIYFYKTSNFFYAFWGYKPEFFRPRMGLTKFVVIRKDLSESWFFGL